MHSIFKKVRSFGKTESELLKVKIIIKKFVLKPLANKTLAKTTKSNTYLFFQMSHDHNTAHLRYQQNKMEHCLEKKLRKRKKWM